MGLLSPYRVLDLTDVKGMFASKLLADMGATVIRIEQPGLNPSDESLEFAYLNAGKKRISLNLNSEKGHEIFHLLLKSTDIIVESYSPGYLESLNLEYQQLVEVSSPLIMASITPFGQSGPYRDFPADDLVLQALGGWLSLSGKSDAPLKLYGNQTYYAASLFAINGILLALYERHRSEKGQHLDISIIECVAATLDYALPARCSGEAVSERRGNRYGNNAFQVFRCLDGSILLSLTQHWERLVEWLDSENMADDLTDEKWRDKDERNQGIDHIIEVLQSWALTHTVVELEEKGQLMHFPWAGIRSIPQLLSSLQLKERYYFTEIEMAGTSKRYQAPGATIKMNASPWQPGDLLVVPGESNMDIYQGELGLTEDEMESLSSEGVI